MSKFTLSCSQIFILLKCGDNQTRSEKDQSAKPEVACNMFTRILQVMPLFMIIVLGTIWCIIQRSEMSVLGGQANE